ncbi:hypothetical protein BTVI_107632 [Pitangus sulphuratus]|nr:hypothetical protein BTVI_107632 [Pitangus sulphuratus]
MVRQAVPLQPMEVHGGEEIHLQPVEQPHARAGPEAPCILGVDYLRREYFKDPKGYRWAFGVVTVTEEKSKRLSALPDLSEDPSIVGLLRVEDQQVPIATTTVHSPTICHGLIQATLEKGKAPEHIQYIDDIIVWGDTAEIFNKEKKIIQILLKTGFVTRKRRNQKWKAAVWSPTQRVGEATEGEGESSQFAELKAVQLALDIAEREGWPRLYLYTD